MRHDHASAHFPDCARNGECRCETRRYTQAFAIVTCIGVLELVYAYFTNGLVLLADAGHAIADSIGLLVLIRVSILVRKRREEEKRIHAIGFNISVALLIGTVIWILIEAHERYLRPQEVEGFGVLVIASIATLGNVWQMRILEHGPGHDVHRAAYAHALTDAGMSATAAVSGIVVWTSGRREWDTLFSLFLAVWIAILIVCLIKNRGTPAPHAH